MCLWTGISKGKHVLKKKYCARSAEEVYMMESELYLGYTTEGD